MNAPVLSVAQMRDAERGAFSRGTMAGALMDAAGAGIADFVQKIFPQPARCLVFAGKGNNGGDALVAATALKRAGWQVDLHFADAEVSELQREKLTAFRNASPPERTISSNLVILDGLLGLGSKPPLREPVLSACRRINQLRRERNACVFAVDLPSGLDADTGAFDDDGVVADFTVTIGAAKRGLLADGVINLVGRLEVVALPELRCEEIVADESVACAGALRTLLPRREFSSYKNQYGRIGIVAGSRGFIGAALLSAEGALRGGAGLVEVFVPDDVYPFVAAAAPAEAMVKPVKSYAELHKTEVDVWAIGPGLGRAHAREILALICELEQPAVIDADALNIISSDVYLLERVRAPRLLTPHPGEMKRLGANSDLPRAEIAQKFVAKYPVTLLFKGSRTIVAEKGRPLSYNSTGNPGMATGGMGDVLTGVCAALIGQHLSAYDAARLGAWWCGRAAEIARFNDGESEQSLLPRDLLAALGRASQDLQTA